MLEYIMISVNLSRVSENQVLAYYAILWRSLAPCIMYSLFYAAELSGQFYVINGTMGCFNFARKITQKK